METSSMSNGRCEAVLRGLMPTLSNDVAVRPARRVGGEGKYARHGAEANLRMQTPAGRGLLPAVATSRDSPWNGRESTLCGLP